MMSLRTQAHARDGMANKKQWNSERRGFNHRPLSAGASGAQYAYVFEAIKPEVARPTVYLREYNASRAYYGLHEIPYAL